MPARLTGVIVLLSCSALLNFLSGHWLTAVLGVVLLAAWLKGTEAMRYALIAFSGTGLAVTAIVLLAEAETGTIPVEALSGLLTGVAANTFSVWCLRQADVQEWMVRPSHPDAFRDAWRATGTSAASLQFEVPRLIRPAAIARELPPDDPLVGAHGTRIWEGGLPEAAVEPARVKPTAAEIEPTVAVLSPAAAEVEPTVAMVSPPLALLEPMAVEVDLTIAVERPPLELLEPMAVEVDPTVAVARPALELLEPAAAEVPVVALRPSQPQLTPVSGPP